LMREAGVEEEIEQMKEIGKNVSAMGAMQTSLNDEISKVNQEIAQTGQDLSAWTTSPVAAAPEPSSKSTQETAGEPVTKSPEPGNTAQDTDQSSPPNTPPDTTA
jgi:hypothetical protein